MKLINAIKLLQQFKARNYKTKSYFSKSKEHTENINPWVSSPTNTKRMILPKCAICGTKKSRFFENQEAKGLLSNWVQQHH